MVGVSGLECRLHAIATLYDELCPVREGEVQNVGSGVVPITHDDITESIQKAMFSAMAAMPEGILECGELEVMEKLGNEEGDILSQIKIATFHAFCHETPIQQAVTPKCREDTIERSIVKANQLELEGDSSKAGFLMKHIRSILWLIGLKEDILWKYYVEAAVWLKGTLFDTNGQLTGLRRGWNFHLRYALGNCLYQIAMYKCHEDLQMQMDLFSMALSELASCGREIAEETNEFAAHHQDASWALTSFGKVAKVIIKQHQGTSPLGDVREVYNEAAVYARKIGRGDLEELLSRLCSGLREHEGYKWKLGRHAEELSDEEDEDLDEEPKGNTSAAVGFKIFVEVLKSGVELASKSDDLFDSFDLLSHACWWTKESLRCLPFEHLMYRFTMWTVEDYVEAKLEICLLLLGIALTVQGEEEEGLHYMESAYKRFESNVKFSASMHNIQKLLARAYAEGHAISDHRKAAEMYESASKTADNLQTQLKMDMDAAAEWVKVPEERVNGMKKIQAIMHMALEILPYEWKLQASLYFDAGRTYLEAEDEEEAVEYMKAGAELCADNDYAFTSQDDLKHAREIVIGLSRLLILYSRKENLAAALALHRTVDPVLMNLKCLTGEDKLWKDTAWCGWQQALKVFKKATGTDYNANVKEVEFSDRYSGDISKFMLSEDIGGGYTYLFAIAEHFQNLADAKAEHCLWAEAVVCLDTLEEKLRKRRVLSKKAEIKLHVNRANYLMGGAKLLDALEEIEKAVEMMRNEEEDRDLLRKIYVTRAKIFLNLQDIDAACASLDMAEKACDEVEALRQIRVLRGILLMKAGKLEMAEELARESALSYANAQSKLGLESAWVHYLDNTEMGNVFSFEESLHRKKKDAMTALVWAERGRSRLFMHHADQFGSKEFDQSDQFAQDIIWNTIDLCGPGTVIIECSIVGPVLILYGLVSHLEKGRGCFTHERSLDDFFNVPANCKAGKKLMNVVVKVRQHIRAGEDEKAIPGLTVLHTLLVQNMLNAHSKWLSSCTSIIFAPQGMLHLVPFMALYDGTAQKFLIEQKAVSVIPSICSLVHCFSRQQNLENKFPAVDGAFVAGNPEPMGLSMKPLPGAAEEAQEVAKVLGVEPCKGINITKEVVVKALSERIVVLLATHGLTRKHDYPFGAIVLRSAQLDNSGQVESLGKILDARNSSKLLEQKEVLTSEEITSIEGGISAGLVVLSACFTGMGEISREGLLGLGHALLRAGACSAIVDLWDVDDDSMGILIADVFKEMKKGTDVLHSVQKAVVDMLRGPEPRSIQHWSALTLLGSPSFQLPDHMQTLKGNQKQDSLDFYSTDSRLLAHDIGGSTMYMRAVVQYYEDQARRRQDEGDFDTAIAVVNVLEENLQNNGLVSDIAKSKLHLWRGRYMNHWNGRSREALKELQKAIEVLPDFNRTPKLVALVFLEQAKAYLKLRDRNGAGAALDRAMESVTKCNHDNIFLYHSKVLRSFALSDDREFMVAASFVREAQLEGGLEGTRIPVWIPFVDDAGLQNTFSLYEMLSLGQGDVNKAVVWAEQGCTHEFGDDAETDGAAANNMLKTLALCGPDTVIIKYSYHQQNLLMLYGLSNKVSVFSRKYLKNFFSEETTCVMGTNLEELVSCVLQFISRGEDERSILGLSILYDLLVRPILVHYKEFFDGYTKIIFAPQGFLCKVPFAALYDASKDKFLVEQMAVGVIPSLRSLQCCFSRQHVLERNLKSKEYSNAFVGSYPKPMVLSLEQLPNTCQTAQEVAGILNVEACPSNDLTKELVLESLSTCDMVMLATLTVGSNREHPYPYGAMVLKQDTAGHDQVLTCDDFATLVGKMKAILVVTIACHNGQHGEVSNREGLLGLGHAALEAGAVTAIASLWDVNDDTLSPLVSPFFRELKQGNDVLYSMQKAMKDVARSTEIRHWASLTVLGSPTLRISTQAKATHQPAPASESHNPNAAGTSTGPTVVSLDSLRINCLQILDIRTNLGPLHALPQEVCEMVLQTLAKEETEKLKEADEGGCDPVTEIMGCGYLGLVYGGTGDWITARRWLVRSLSIARENWVIVKDNLEPDPLALSARFISFLLRLHGTSSLNADLELVRFVLRSVSPTNESLFDNIHQALAIWE